MRPKLLIVDDREDNLFSIETILESGGYLFVRAKSGREALKILLHEQDFALILMDVQMPNMNGFETSSLIYEREKLKHIPIIFITAQNYSEDNVDKGYRSGAVDYIYKPINPELLKAKVSVFIDLYRKNYQLLAQEQKLISINKALEAEIHDRIVSEEKVKALNLELLKNIDRLESANKELDRFAFMASHDLQEPLRKIYTFSDILNSRYAENLDEEAKVYLKKIQVATAHLRKLIKDILTFSTIPTNEKNLIESDLNEVLREVLSDMEERVYEKRATVQVESLPKLHVNPVLIRPLFQNLLSNALKYSKKDVSPMIRVYADSKESSASNTYCRIFVEDNGIGFDQQYADKIFNMFSRLHQNGEIEGTGIGLALCKKIVEVHNGFITARSKLNDGATFIVSLPSAPLYSPVNIEN